MWLLDWAWGAIVCFDTNSPADDWADEITTTYDDFGRPKLVKSKNGSTILNAVKFEYSNAGLPTKLIQEPDGDVDGSSLAVEYEYEHSPASNYNHRRMSTLVYPDGFELDYYYGILPLSGDAPTNYLISRLGQLRFGGDLSPSSIGYDYIGTRTPAIVDYSEPDVQLTRFAAHDGERQSGEYPGFTRYGQVARHMWVDGGFDEHASDPDIPNAPPIVELEYDYNNAGSRTNRYDARPGAKQVNCDWTYEYDDLRRLTDADRGYDDGL